MSRFLIITLVIVACADPEVRTSVDPVATPTIEMSTPARIEEGVLLQWRYLAEGSELSEFQIRRSTENGSVDLGSISASASAEWQEAAYVDSIFVAGVEVQYSLRAFDRSGGEIAFASERFRTDGTELLVGIDNENLAIDLTWRSVPTDALGFEVLRTDLDGATTILEVLNADVRGFEDRPPQGNTYYQYEILTLLPGNGKFRSASIPARLYGFGYSTTASASAARYLLYRDTNVAPRVLAARSPDPLILQGSVQLAINLPEANANSLSVGGLFYQDNGLLNCVVGRNETDTEVFLAAFPVPPEGLANTITDPATILEWPSKGGTQTGVAWAGDGPGKLVFYEGTHLRVLVDSFKVEEEATIDSEPIDIEYQSGSIWLAYPNRLLRSNDTFLSEGFVSWEEVSIPAGTTITSLSRLFRNQLLVLDGRAGKLHSMSLQGEILLSTDARGSDLTKGDAIFRYRPNTEPEIHQTDGSGIVHIFLWPSDVQNEVQA